MTTNGVSDYRAYYQLYDCNDPPKGAIPLGTEEGCKDYEVQFDFEADNDSNARTIAEAYHGRKGLLALLENLTAGREVRLIRFRESSDDPKEESYDTGSGWNDPDDDESSLV